ncbi:MAG: COP23 domain-containing protein [Microcoleaceae cyanobacterium]
MVSSPRNSNAHPSGKLLKFLALSVSATYLLSSGQAKAQWIAEDVSQAQLPPEEVWDLEEIPDADPNPTQEIPAPAPQPQPETRNEPIDLPGEPNAYLRFFCESVDNQYTVMYYPASQPNQSYPWAIPGAMGGGWTPERRCNEIARRLEAYRPDGLSELQTGIENGYNVICATTEDVPDCRIVLTVPPGENPELVRDRIFENLVTADTGTPTQGVYTFTEDGSGLDIFQGLFGRSRRQQSPQGIDLKPFLDRLDRGNGANLR